VVNSDGYKCWDKTRNEVLDYYIYPIGIKYAIPQIRERSPILKKMEDKGEIKIVGAFYRLTDGTLEFIK
jgi:carbonic anhydrase